MPFWLQCIVKAKLFCQKRVSPRLTGLECSNAKIFIPSHGISSEVNTEISVIGLARLLDLIWTHRDFYKGNWSEARPRYRESPVDWAHKRKLSKYRMCPFPRLTDSPTNKNRRYCRSAEWRGIFRSNSPPPPPPEGRTVGRERVPSPVFLRG